VNAYCKTERQQAQINREHFMLYHWHFFPECREWTRDDMVNRLKLEGLLSPHTNACDCTSVSKFWRELKVATSI